MRVLVEQDSDDLLRYCEGRAEHFGIDSIEGLGRIHLLARDETGRRGPCFVEKEARDAIEHVGEKTAGLRDIDTLASLLTELRSNSFGDGPHVSVDLVRDVLGGGDIEAFF